MSRHHIVTSHPLDVVGEGIITVTKGAAPSGRIRSGESVNVDGHKGLWRVLAFHRAGAELESINLPTRQTLRGIAYSQLKRVTR